MSIARTVYLLALCVFSSGSFAADPLEPVNLRLKWKHQFQFAGYYAALEKGYYQEAGFDVTLQQSVPGISELDALEQGVVEFAASDATAILHRLWGRPVVVINPIFPN